MVQMKKYGATPRVRSRRRRRVFKRRKVLRRIGKLGGYLGSAALALTPAAAFAPFALAATAIGDSEDRLRRKQRRIRNTKKHRVADLQKRVWMLEGRG